MSNLKLTNRQTYSCVKQIIHSELPCPAPVKQFPSKLLTCIILFKNGERWCIGFPVLMPTCIYWNYFVVTYSNLQFFSANAWSNNDQENIDIDNRREKFIFLNKAPRSYSVGELVFSGRLAQMVWCPVPPNGCVGRSRTPFFSALLFLAGGPRTKCSDPCSRCPLRSQSLTYRTCARSRERYLGRRTLFRQDFDRWPCCRDENGKPRGSYLRNDDGWRQNCGKLTFAFLTCSQPKSGAAADDFNDDGGGGGGVGWMIICCLQGSWWWCWLGEREDIATPGWQGQPVQRRDSPSSVNPCNSN